MPKQSSSHSKFGMSLAYLLNCQIVEMNLLSRTTLDQVPAMGRGNIYLEEVNNFISRLAVLGPATYFFYEVRWRD
jgi:hypothetical protein